MAFIATGFTLFHIITPNTAAKTPVINMKIIRDETYDNVSMFKLSTVGVSDDVMVIIRTDKIFADICNIIGATMDLNFSYTNTATMPIINA